jgi:hypothetical protein
MSARALARVVLAWGVVTLLACVLVRAHFRLRMNPARDVVVASVWSGGELVGRAAVAHPGDPDPALDAALAAHPGATRVDERIVGDGPVVSWPRLALAMSIVPAHEGLAATLDGHSVFVTPDELLAWQAYDKELLFPALQLGIGVDTRLVLALLGDRLHVPVSELLSRGQLWRFRAVRVQNADPATPTPESLSADDARTGAIAAADYLARGVDERGRFRYLVDAPRNHSMPGYDWPRHSGATYFLAQVASLTGDEGLASAARRAAGLLRDHALTSCGEHRCIADGPLADVGSSALALLAFVELAQTGIDPGYARVVPALTEFLRSQQRDDGELMHLYDRNAREPVDVQWLYSSGEAALALSRAHGLLGEPLDLEASVRIVEHLVHRAWTFFGSRYYWGEEHWTCQAMNDLWPHVKDEPGQRTLRDALDFCLGWAAYGRQLMYAPADTPFDADGAYGFGPVVTPRLTPAGSRTEAGIATLVAGRRAGLPASRLAPLEAQLRRSLAMLLRHQFRPGPVHLFADPDAVEGAFPGSEVDWAIRIDYPQHTGSALVAWLAMVQAPSARPSAPGAAPLVPPSGDTQREGEEK